MQLCADCGRCQARVRLAALVDGAVTVMYLCAVCALARRIDDDSVVSPDLEQPMPPGVARRAARGGHPDT
jgi:hypothetical protein